MMQRDMPAPQPVLRSFAVFYRSEYRAVVGLARVLSGSGAIAEDLAQDAFAIAHRHWAHVGTLDRPEAWVRKVLANSIVSWRRRIAAEARALLRMWPAPGSVPELGGDAAMFWDAVRRLPERQRIAIALFYYDGWGVAEIADVMECAVGTAKSHLHDGRKRLARDLGLTMEDLT